MKRLATKIQHPNTQRLGLSLRHVPRVHTLRSLQDLSQGYSPLIPHTQFGLIRYPEFIYVGISTESKESKFFGYVTFGNQTITRDYTGEPSERLSIGSNGSNPSQFNTAYGLAIHPHTQNVYVADFCNHRIQAFTPQLEFLFEFGSRGTDERSFQYPAGLAFSSDGKKLAIVDNDNRRIKITDPEGNLIEIIDGSGVDQGAFDEPYFITTDRDDNLYIADRDRLRVQKYTFDGKFISFIGDKGGVGNTVGNVCGVCISDQDELVTHKEGGNELKYFSLDGKFLRSVPTPDTSSRKSFLARGPHGGLILSDRGGDKIHFFDKDGKHYHSISLPAPLGVAFNNQNDLYIVHCDKATIAMY
eukprot:TRINITY_DN6552_c0_g1_i1.p1 TRINITY_DN6552_c0_g1~~TRINITY_DN6552_c0_g1_i1.p1  ORF type:complete len:358 (+),score=44.28 TRINITY_DN6552_c0_g1_i1:690-1763(+)